MKKTLITSISIGTALFVTAPLIHALDVKVVGDSHRENHWQVTELTGMAIHNESGHQVGTIADIELNDQMQAQAYYVSVGGFFGVGDTVLRVPTEAVKVKQGKDQRMKAHMARSDVEVLARYSEDLANNLRKWKDEKAEQAKDQADQMGDKLEEMGEDVRAKVSEMSAETQSFFVTTWHRLNDSYHLDADELADLNIEVTEDQVRISGTVSSREARDRIIDAARDSSDRQVIHNIRVKNS